MTDILSDHNTAKFNSGIETNFPALPSHFSFSFLCTSINYHHYMSDAYTVMIIII